VSRKISKIAARFALGAGRLSIFEERLKKYELDQGRHAESTHPADAPPAKK
jgi:hypothetical protein